MTIETGRENHPFFGFFETKENLMMNEHNKWWE